MSRPATQKQLDYLTKLRAWVSTYSPDAEAEADDVRDGESSLDIGEASDAIEKMLELLEQYQDERAAIESGQPVFALFSPVTRTARDF